VIPLKMIKPHINSESIRTTAFADHINNIADQPATIKPRKLPPAFQPTKILERSAEEVGMITTQAKTKNQCSSARMKT
jgi:hypothetical protein